MGALDVRGAVRIAALVAGLIASACEAAGPAPSPDRAPAPTDTTTPVPAPDDPDDHTGWTDDWILAQTDRYLDDAAFRRRMLEASLTEPTNVYSASRWSAYGRETSGWDVLPEWIPAVATVDDTTVSALRRGEAVAMPTEPIWDGQRPTTMAQWVALGERVFFRYPLRPEVFAEHALAHPQVATEIGLAAAPDGTWAGLVTFRDLDGRARVGITCALCHVSLEDEAMIVGRARRGFDYGGMRLAYHRDTGEPLPAELAARMATWGPGRADITQDDDEDPVAIPDLWQVRDESYLTQAGTLHHVHPAVLAIRQETQILHANLERTRPPRELAWALAMYVYSLTPPPSATVAASGQTDAGRAVFEVHCRRCHAEPNGTGPLVDARTIGTEPSLAFGHARGTGRYRPAPLVRVADAAPYLHHGVVPSLDDLLDPARLDAAYTRGAHGPGAIAGHRWGTDLPVADRDALLAYLRTL